MTGWNMKTLLNALGEEVLEVHGNSGVVFGEISTDSRRITKNCIFHYPTPVIRASRGHPQTEKIPENPSKDGDCQKIHPIR